MMKPSEFQTTIENQFDYICKVAMEDERKDYLKVLSRQCKRETLFCDIDDYTVNLFSSEDTYPSHFHTFDDTEISKILEVNRSTIQRRRHAGLEFIIKFMEWE
ncbi:DNA-binding protein [Enterocloster clostridioformis]|nr:sigma-70 family RNA polymerase sigma factor [Enterocloster clostridioformis]OXE66460.1 DNA-binding protein [Enterocloster clostridioformis]